MKKDRMLIVDDMEVNRAILREVFSGQFEIIEATSGIQALEIMRIQELSIVLLDYIMPDMDGLELLRIRKDEERLRIIPVVMVSGNDNIEDQVAAFKLGANDYLVKPINPALASLRIENIISNHVTMQAFRREREALMDQVERDQVTLGHAKGDELLQRVGECLKSAFRSGDTVSRLGGDEFIAFLPAVTDIGVIKDKITALLRQISEIDLVGDVPCPVGASAGIAQYPKDGCSFEALYKQADAALYYAKHCGKGQLAVYNEIVEQNLQK